MAEGIALTDGDAEQAVRPGIPASEASIRALLAAYDWDVDEALAVATCESRLNPMATGSAGERGIFQIHPVHARAFDWSRAYEPAVNIAYAYRLWRDQGWAPWTCWTGGYAR